MCGIVGYIGKQKALPIVLEGLKRLEYRGYDSVGVLVCDSKTKNIYLEKQPGRIQNFLGLVKADTIGNLAIGHTRWATHGGVTRENAHPHSDCSGKIFVVHNGIIENFQTIKESLVQKGHRFSSETDTEVVPHLIEELMKEGLDYEAAIEQTLKDIKGSFALLIFHSDFPETICGARLSSPLILGTNDREFIFASDSTPVSLLTKNVVYLDDGDFVFVTPGGYRLQSFLSDKAETKTGIIDFTAEEADKGKFPDYMLKEIFEEPDALKNTLRGRLVLDEGKVKFGGLEGLETRLRAINRVLLVACGTAGYAGQTARYFFEEYAELPTQFELASEFRYRKPIIDGQTLFVAISQSGETADTLAAIKEAKTKNALTLGIVNVVGSSIARLVDAGIYSHAGPELAVASTKAFTTQIAGLVLLMVFLARERNMSLVMGQRILKELHSLPEKMQTVLAQQEKIKALADKYSKYKDFLFLGRKYNFPIALEGALKLKEVSYLHAEGYASGEMKHGPIALIDENFPSVVVAPQDSVYEKSVSNIQELKARKGRVLVITTEGNKEMEKLADDVIYIPKTLEILTPILISVPLHLFAYFMAQKLKRDIDRPRNLAKSVTVE